MNEKQNPLKDKSFQFALSVIKLYKKFNGRKTRVCIGCIDTPKIRTALLI